MLLEATHRMGNSQRVYASIIRLIVDGSIVTARNNFIGRVIINPFPPAGQHRCRDTQHGLAIGGCTEHMFRLVSSYKRHRRRSEEHTSEPQSLMPISYAVYSLNNQKKTSKRNT